MARPALSPIISFTETAPNQVSKVQSLNQASLDLEQAMFNPLSVAMRELGRVYQLFARGLRAAADGNVAARQPMTASRLNELLLAVSAA